MPDPECVHSVGVKLALGQARYFGAVDRKHYVVAFDLNSQRVGLPAILPLLDDRGMRRPVDYSDRFLSPSRLAMKYSPLLCTRKYV